MQHAPAAISERPAYADIANRAYFIYLEEGMPIGRSADYWRRAEQELLRRAAAAERSGPRAAGRLPRHHERRIRRPREPVAV